VDGIEKAIGLLNVEMSDVIVCATNLGQHDSYATQDSDRAAQNRTGPLWHTQHCKPAGRAAAYNPPVELKDVVVRGTGRYVPERVFTNSEFEAIIDTSDEWIRERTGIRERRLAGPDEQTSDMALAASMKALARAGVGVDEIGLIIVATVTPDTVFPSTANWLQGKLGNRTAWSFDLNAACGGFIYALSVATGLLRTGQMRYCLLIGAEKMSAILDFTSRETCVLFGDGAGAMLLEAVDPADNPADYGVREFVLGSDGTLADILWQPDGGSASPPRLDTLARHGHFVHMQGREVYKHAVRRMNQVVLDVLDKVGVPPAEIDWYVPHQANIRIIQSVQERLGVPMERFFVNIERYGNTTAATIPLCMAELDEQGQLQPGSKLVLFTFGAGFTWGSCYLVWGHGK
jgi:3-oxoacyl-[acyl-carrier-protein] synthase-3